MSRQELADEVDKYLFHKTEREFDLDDNYVGKLERGEHRWPSALYRDGFRAVLNVSNDADLGFHVIRGLSNASNAPTAVEPPNVAAPYGKITDIAGATSDHSRREPTDRFDGPVDAAENGGRNETYRADVDDDHDEPDGFDLWGLNDVLRGTRIGSQGLALAEAACARLDQRYAELPPRVLLPRSA